VKHKSLKIYIHLYSPNNGSVAKSNIYIQIYTERTKKKAEINNMQYRLLP